MYEDVDREGRSLGKRYHKLTRTLKRQLEGRWHANIAAKEALIASASALVVDGAPVPDSARQAKALQAQWKEIDITPRSADRKLWSDFRAACDAVFKGIANARSEANAAQDAVRGALVEATRSYNEALGQLRARGAGTLADADFSGLPEQALRSAMDALDGAGGPPAARKAASENNAIDWCALITDMRHISRIQAEIAQWDGWDGDDDDDDEANTVAAAVDGLQC